MVGLIGRSSFLLNCRLGQYSRRCSVVSAGLSQLLRSCKSFYLVEQMKLFP